MTKEIPDTQALPRTLPYNVQAEQMLLGAILINPDLLNHVTEFLKAEHFFEILHQKIYNAILAITDKGITPTQIAIKTIIDREEDFKQAGHEYLTKLATLAIIVINPYDYGRLIHDLAIKRNLIKIGEFGPNDLSNVYKYFNHSKYSNVISFSVIIVGIISLKYWVNIFFLFFESI